MDVAERIDRLIGGQIERHLFRGLVDRMRWLIGFPFSMGVIWAV
jgi:hypothetical protein